MTNFVTNFAVKHLLRSTKGCWQGEEYKYDNKFLSLRELPVQLERAFITSFFKIENDK